MFSTGCEKKGKYKDAKGCIFEVNKQSHKEGLLIEVNQN
jgi:hypothetical protein